jgi:hypothetical protein
VGIGISRDFGVGSLPRKRALVFCLGVFLFRRVLRIGVLECWAHVLDGIEVVVAVAEFTFALLLRFGGVLGVDRELWFSILLIPLFTDVKLQASASSDCCLGGASAILFRGLLKGTQEYAVCYYMS